MSLEKDEECDILRLDIKAFEERLKRIVERYVNNKYPMLEEVKTKAINIISRLDTLPLFLADSSHTPSVAEVDDVIRPIQGLLDDIGQYIFSTKELDLRLQVIREDLMP